MNKSIILTLALMFTSLISKAQKDVYLTIAHKLNTADFAFNQSAQNNLANDFKITRVDYYISGIKIIHDGGMEINVPNKYILVKGSSNLNELLGNFNVTNVEGIKFSVGVEAPTNNADPALQAQGSALSFQSPSMHWGWTAGYRFFALEGMAGANFNTMFQIHGLGNANYFSQTQMATGIPRGNNIYINLKADYTQAVKGINVNNGPVDHGVDATDLTLLKNVRDFVFSPSSSILSINNFENNNLAINIYPNPAKDKLFINFGTQKADKVIITDITGKIMNTIALENANEIDMSAFNSGIYIFQFQSNNNNIAFRKIIVE